MLEKTGERRNCLPDSSVYNLTHNINNGPVNAGWSSGIKGSCAWAISQEFSGTIYARAHIVRMIPFSTRQI